MRTAIDPATRRWDGPGFGHPTALDAIREGAGLRSNCRIVLYTAGEGAGPGSSLPNALDTA